MSQAIVDIRGICNIVYNSHVLVVRSIKQWNYTGSFSKERYKVRAGCWQVVYSA